MKENYLMPFLFCPALPGAAVPSGVQPAGLFSCKDARPQAVREPSAPSAQRTAPGASPVSGYWLSRLLPSGKKGERAARRFAAKRRRARYGFRERTAGPVCSREQGFSRLDIAWPMLGGMVISAFLGFFVVLPRLSGGEEQAVPVSGMELALEEAVPEPEPSGAEEEISGLPEPSVHPLARRAVKGGDPIQAAWRDSRRRDQVLAFFTEITGSEELSFSVLSNAEAFRIPPALAFALSWEESRFNPKAVNRANRDRTVDRGLFQLNSRSFPGLSEEQFFDAWQNTYYGMAHLRFCLDQGGSIVSGLAMYNAGTGRVTAGGGAPKITLDYVSRIIDTAARIEELYGQWDPPPVVVAVAEEPLPAAEPSPSALFRLARLSPVLRMGHQRFR
jgi:hypothetical protein